MRAVGLSEGRIRQTKTSSRDASLTMAAPTVSGALERELSISVPCRAQRINIHLAQSLNEGGPWKGVILG